MPWDRSDLPGDRWVRSGNRLCARECVEPSTGPLTGPVTAGMEVTGTQAVNRVTAPDTGSDLAHHLNDEAPRTALDNQASLQPPRKEVLRRPP